MTKTITNHMLRKKMKYVTQQNQIIRGINTPLGNEDTVETLLEERKIVKVKGNKVITDQGVEAVLFSPLPCIYWKCLTPPDNNGVSTLKQPLHGLIINNGNNSYCVGVSGASSEFELRCQIGDDEVRMNNLFLNIKTSHLVKNGLEVKDDE